jgi:hypothetical protein
LAGQRDGEVIECERCSWKVRVVDEIDMTAYGVPRSIRSSGANFTTPWRYSWDVIWD